ncbi:MAG TPA: HEAT repeat domain-containing protein [Candidatus Ozemobacteraceae bacterium]|nr:HEAT repeat domain-containing protein [Candidatus Ozemobacteraceae bacterium]
MGWFSRKISDPEEAFGRLLQKDKRTSDRAKSDFVSSMNHGLIEFLHDKFEENDNLETRLKILEVFVDYRNQLNEEDLRLLLTLIKYPDTLLRETFKEILVGIKEENLKAVTEVLGKTLDPDIHRTIQHGIEKSGILKQLLEKWNNYSVKEQILYLEEIVMLQNPKTYPIFFDILKEEVVEAKKDEKKILQVEFSKHVDKIKNPDFLDLCIRELPAIAPGMRYPVFKCLQSHGKLFFEKVFDGLGKKSEGFRQHTLKLMEQLSDPMSYQYLFPFLLDPYKSIPPTVADTIGKIIKDYAEELDKMDPAQRKSPEVQAQIKYFTDPLENNLNDRYFQCIKLMTECLLRLGRYDHDVIFRNFAKIFRYNEGYLKSFLKGLDPAIRKNLLINACCYKDVETGKTALKILGDPTENYIIETLNTLLLEHFMEVPPEVQSETIQLMMDPRLQRFVTEVLYHQDPALRSRILTILGESGLQNALQILETKLRDPDYSVRMTILKILDLKHFQNNAGTEMLLNFLKDSDSSIVLQTIERLKERDHPMIINNLTKLLASNVVEIKQAAHKAIAFVTRRKYMTGFDKMTEDARKAIGQSLIKMDTSFMEDITRDLSASDQRTRVLSAKILEVLCDHIPPELKTHLIVAIQDPDPQVRAVVIMGLGKIGGPSVSGMLVGFLKDQDDRVRANAVEAMAEVGDISLAEEILPCLYDDNNRVRANTIITLWKLGYYQIYEPVIEMMRHPDRWMRASAAFALGELKDSRFFPILIQAIRDPEPDVRRNVIKALGKIVNPFMLAPYIRPLRFDPDENVRKEVMAVLSAKPPAPAQ